MVSGGDFSKLEQISPSDTQAFTQDAKVRLVLSHSGDHLLVVLPPPEASVKDNADPVLLFTERNRNGLYQCVPFCCSGRISFFTMLCMDKELMMDVSRVLLCRAF